MSFSLVLVDTSVWKIPRHGLRIYGAIFDFVSKLYNANDERQHFIHNLTHFHGCYHSEPTYSAMKAQFDLDLRDTKRMTLSQNYWKNVLELYHREPIKFFVITAFVGIEDVLKYKDMNVVFLDFGGLIAPRAMLKLSNVFIIEEDNWPTCTILFRLIISHHRLFGGTWKDDSQIEEVTREHNYLVDRCAQRLRGLPPVPGACSKVITEVLSNALEQYATP